MRQASSSIQSPNNHGLTLVEILVVIAIVGVLAALLLPAVQMARESARRASCSNNLKQVALATSLHGDIHNSYPTGGWGERWVGDPDAGFGENQPGGWAYNILPHIEQTTLRDLGAGLRGADRQQAIDQLLQSFVETYYCSSRRAPGLYPYRGPTSLENAVPPGACAKVDYAFNEKLSHLKSEVPIEFVKHQKGFAKTLLAAEKTLPRSLAETGTAQGDKLTAYSGDSSDIRRSAAGSPSSEGALGFGGPHPTGCLVAYCDGSVKFVSESDPLEPD